VLEGLVLAEDTGEPLIGAHVKLKGDISTGAISDLDGKFTLEVPAGEQTIVISFTGMLNRTLDLNIAAGSNTRQTIRLTPYANELQGVEIKVGRFDRSIEEITSSLEIIKPDLIQNKNVTSISTILDFTPGLNILDGEPQIRGGSGFTFGVGSKVGVFIDGMPVLSGDASRPYWELVPIENIDQIEVVKGCASVMSGANALSGAIYIRTARPSLEPKTKIKVYGGGYTAPQKKYMKWWSGLAYIGGADYFHTRIIKNTDITIGANVHLDHGFIGAPKPGPLVTDTLTNFSDSQLAKQRYRFNFNIRQRSEKIEGLNYGINGNIMSNKSNMVLAWLDDSTGFYRAYPGAVILQDQFVFYLDPFVNFYSKIGITHSFKTRIMHSNLNQSNDQTIRSNVYYADYNFGRKYEFLKGFAFTGGLTFQYNDVHSNMYEGFGTPDNSLLNLSGYAEVENNFFDLINLSVGARLEYFSLNDSVQEAKPVFRAGLSLKLLQETYLRFSIGQGYRYPTIAERFIETDLGSFGVFPNSTLVPESSLNAELGVKQGFKFANYFGYFDIAVFQQEYDNTIEYLFGQWAPRSADTWPFYGFRFVNTGKSKITGVDISLTGIAQLGKKASLKTMFGYNYILPKTLEPDLIFATDSVPIDLSYRTTSVDPSKNILKYRFLHSVKGDVEVNIYNFSVGFSLKYFSRIENLDKSIQDLEEYTKATGGSIQPIQYMNYFFNHNNGQFIADARVSYTLKKKHRFTLVSDNVFNKWYSLRPLMPEQMRKVVFQYSLTF
jgi:iron complex outermembrane receptor protein